MVEIQTQQMVLTILKLIEQHGSINFRDLMIRLPELGAQNVWDTLKYLQKETIIENVKISNRKNKWQIQRWYMTKQDIDKETIVEARVKTK